MTEFNLTDLRLVQPEKELATISEKCFGNSI
jgi:hypothetical protein